MTQASLFTYRPGRRLMGTLAAGQDLLAAVEALCREQDAKAAVFQVWGTVKSLTVGGYDPSQQVWVTENIPGFHEIISCTGSIFSREGAPEAVARILAADLQGKVTGGRLFSDAEIVAAEIDIQVLDGPGLSRIHDPATGLWRLALTPGSRNQARGGLFQSSIHEGGKSMNIAQTLTDNPKPKPAQDKLGFGTLFTDHMFKMDYAPDKGWHNPRIEPYGPLSMDPSTMVLHYGQEVFEGLKAYRNPDGAIQLFRPLENIRRMNRSCQRLCIPPMDEAVVLQSMKALIELEKDWVPGAEGTSLYIRPTIIAMDPFLGVRASHTYLFYIILSPVGAYYAEGFNPVKILVSKSYVRAVRGGVGEAKTCGNYAASLLAGDVAHKEGYTQVLWLDGVEQKYIEEVGSMNIFFVIGDEIVTPELNGSILPGVTRDSVLRLAKSWGLTAVERKISIDEVMAAHADGTLTEIFGSGTAAVISPVGELKYADKIITIGDGQVGPVSNRLYNALTDIQYGLAEDSLGWIEPVG